MEAGRTDVADAAMRGDRTALRSFIQQKADVNAAQVDGASDGSKASTYEHSPQANVGTVKFLLDLGLAPNASNR